MPFGTPTDPTPSTVITVAYAIANILDPIRWLRQLTGGADPPGAGYWLRSTSPSAASWVDRAAEVLAALGYTPVNKAGDTGIGSLALTGSITSTNQINTSSSMQGLYFISTVPTGTAPLGCISTTQVGNLNASYLEGHTAAYFESLVAGGVPAGIIAAWGSAASIPGGWLLCDGGGGRPDLRGRIAVGAANAFNFNHTVGIAYGSDWRYTPAGSVSGGTTGMSVGNTSGLTTFSGLSTPGPDAVQQAHGHSFTSNGTWSGGFTGTQVNWDLPRFAVHWIIKT